MLSDILCLTGQIMNTDISLPQGMQTQPCAPAWVPGHRHLEQTQSFLLSALLVPDTPSKTEVLP